MEPLAVVFIVKDEALGITRAVEAAQRHFNEVHVVDSSSSDSTVALAAAAGAQVHEFVWDRGYPKKKQWCLDHVAREHDWILLLDADEIVDAQFAREVLSCVSGPSIFVAWDAVLAYKFEGRILKHGHRPTKRVLMNRQFVRFPDVSDSTAPGIGEVEGHYQPSARGKIGKLHATLLHDDPDPVATWFARHVNYSKWETWVATHPIVRTEVRGAKSASGRLFDRAPWKPGLFFVYSYFFRRGFLDGRPGLDYALALAWYRWIVSLQLGEAKAALILGKT